jgi:DNA helicase HerA-like ATPase
VPFRIHEILGFINEQMGRLGKPDTAIPYLRLKTRIESLRNDRRFKFLFSSEEDVLAKIVGRLLRVPAEGRPLTIVDLSGVPSEIADVIVSTLCRVLFDFSVWCEREKKPPLLVVCEEAHRYVPADERLGFAQTVASITQIAKEGRKYGISLALITQRPSELALSALSQCGTVFALRLGSDADQRFIARTLPDVAGEMLRALPSLPTAQAIVFGEAVRVPMRIRFDDLPKQRRPHTEGAHHSEAGQTDTADRAFIDTGVRRWRAQIRG